jgi:hypothetical protein
LPIVSYYESMASNYDLAWILPYVREFLRNHSNFSFDGFADGVFEVLDKVGVGEGIEKRSLTAGHTGYTYNFDAVHLDIRLAVTEAFYYLEQNRFILRSPPTNTTAFVLGQQDRQFRITKRGQDWANSAEPVPEDYDGYMKQFGPASDAVVRQYISEALNTFMHGSYFASAVMIGAASEKSIHLLADSMVPALADPAKRTELTKRINARSLERLLKYVEDIVIDGHKRLVIPFDVMGGTTRHLLSLFDHIRLQRNDAIHPMNFVVSADYVRFALGTFPLAFQKVEALQKWCDANPNSL